MKLLDFDYNLPKELIAQHPSKKRDESRLLVLHRDKGIIEHRIFKDIVEYFNKEDLVILNNTKVIPSRLFFKKITGGKLEALILHNGKRPKEYEVLLKPTRGCKLGAKIIFGGGKLEAEVARIENGRRFLKFNSNKSVDELLNELGEMPLPPYIRRNVEESDKERYQTVYASKKGAVAAPTAGLHFTKDILNKLSKKGIALEYITLHVGYGTFKPVKSEDITKHKIEEEYFEVEKEVFSELKSKKNRVIAVGTTSCRTLETIASKDTLKGWSDLFIYPGYKFKLVDALLTNFHFPKTTLFMLVSAFCGGNLIQKAYKEAIDKKYRFYSYGDAMLIL